MAAHHGEGVAGVGEVGLLVGGRAGRGRLEDGSAEVAGRDLVAGGVEGVDGGRSDLAAGAGDEDSHPRRTYLALQKPLDTSGMSTLAPQPPSGFPDGATVSDAPTQVGGRLPRISERDRRRAALTAETA